MGGIRTTGDLVAWMQLARKMKITEAKQYVADKLGIEVSTLTDEEEMLQTLASPEFDAIIAVSGSPKGILAKIRISELLGIPINSVELFKSQLS